MKKDRSNADTTAPGDRGLPRAKILRGRTNFQRLFEPDAETLRNELVDLRFRLYRDSNGGCLMGFIAGKKLGKATQRNRIKRLLREAYRLNQHILTPLFEHTSVSFQGALMAKAVDADFRAVQDQVTDLLNRARDQILPIIDSGL